MSLQATIEIIVGPLPDPLFWFANEAAWANYWEDVTGTITIEPAATNVYVPSPFDYGLEPEDFNIDGVDYIIPSIAQFNSLKAQVAALDDTVQQLRTALKAAGLITEAQ